MMMRDDHRQPDDRPPIRLCDGDGRVLDRLVEYGFDADRLRREERLEDEESRRLERLVETCGLLERYPVEPPHESLVDATLARIDRHERQREERLTIAPGGGRAGEPRRWRMPDFISVAAMLLIVAAIAIPFLNLRGYYSTAPQPTAGTNEGDVLQRPPEAGFSRALDQLFGSGGEDEAMTNALGTSPTLPPNITADPWGEGMILWVPHRTADGQTVWQPKRVLQLYRVRRAPTGPTE